MRMRAVACLCVLIVLPGLVAPAQAQIPVIDIASLTQLIAQIQTLEQQLATARGQLTQAQSTYQSMTGQRGMQQLLAGTPRNYLPGNWPAVQGVLGGAGGYPALSQSVAGAVTSNALLSPAQLAALSPPAAAQLQAQRNSVALLEGISHTALGNASGRFAGLQTLIDAIGRTPDEKGVLELQARIAAEEGMLTNEHSKLLDLYQAGAAQSLANAQRARELTVATHGQFASRFQPQP